MKSSALARFDARITTEQKSLFELAAQLAGFRTLTDFVIRTAHEKAKQIVAESNSAVLSAEDRSIFFDALTNPPKPNSSLTKAAGKYKDSAH